jgi:hypothetical protein
LSITRITVGTGLKKEGRVSTVVSNNEGLFKKKRARLTRVWFFLLAFNVLLQADLVEDWLSSSIHDSPRFVATDRACTSIFQWQSDDSTAPTFNAWGGSLAGAQPTDREHKLSGTALFVPLLVFRCFVTPPTLSAVFIKSADPHLVSGLSPPLSA